MPRGFIPPVNVSETVFVKKVTGLIEKALNLECVQYTCFMDLRQQQLFSACANKYQNINIYYNYGYKGDGERCIGAICPEYFLQSNVKAPIVLLCSPLYSNTLTHRDFLGAIMNLKISRDYIGDIIVKNGYAYVCVHKNISNIIIEELTNVGNSSVCFSEYLQPFEHYSNFENSYSATVASLRADSIISAILNISRNDAAKLIKQGNVSVNHLEIDEGDFEMYDSDIISVRKYGKFKLQCQGNKSRKDRIFISYIKY